MDPTERQIVDLVHRSGMNYKDSTNYNQLCYSCQLHLKASILLTKKKQKNNNINKKKDNIILCYKGIEIRHIHPTITLH